MMVKPVCFDRLLQVLILNGLWIRGMRVIGRGEPWDKGTEARVRNCGVGPRRRLLRLPMIVQDEHPSRDAQSSENGIRHFEAYCEDTRGRIAQKYSACQLLSGNHSNGAVKR